MKTRIATLAAALMLTASIASAAGINLSWTDCGVNGTQNSTFACNSNSGLNVLVASFIPPTGVNEYLGLASQIDIFTDQPSLPDWWKHGSGQCRGTTGISIGFDFTAGPFMCVDFFAGQGAGGYAYDVGFGTLARARLRIQAAIPVDQKGPVDASTEYYAYKVSLLRAKTTGVGSCTGCANSACIVLNDIQLFQPLEAQNDPDIVNPANRSYTTWQTPVNGPPGCPLATPTRTATWGSIKSLYR